MSIETPQHSYICLDCGKSFPASQGSRKRYCIACVAKRQTRGGRPKKVKEEHDGKGDYAGVLAS